MCKSRDSALRFSISHLIYEVHKRDQAPASGSPDEDVGRGTGTWLVAPVSLKASDYFLPTGDGDCLLGVTANEGMDIAGVSLWLLGDVFLSKYFSVWDVANKRLGLATAVSKPPEREMHRWHEDSESSTGAKQDANLARPPLTATRRNSQRPY